MMIGVIVLSVVLSIAIVSCLFPPPKVNSFAQVVKKEDIQFDRNGGIKLRGRFVRSREEDHPEVSLKKNPVLPNGATYASECNLGDGVWLLSGGSVKDKQSDCERFDVRDNYLFNESSKQIRALAPLTQARSQHYLFKLANGDVLVFGGFKGVEDDYLHTSIELLNLTANTCLPICSVATGKVQPSMLEIAPNKVMVFGGSSLGKGDSTDVEIIDIARRSSTIIGQLTRPHIESHIYRISDSDFLLIGGHDDLSHKDSDWLPPELIHLPSSVRDI